MQPYAHFHPPLTSLICQFCPYNGKLASVAVCTCINNLQLARNSVVLKLFGTAEITSEALGKTSLILLFEFEFTSTEFLFYLSFIQ